MMLGPYELNSIVTGDALRLMKDIPNGLVDLTATDPPFGVRQSDTWDNMDAQELARFTMSWISEARRISDSLITFFSGRHLQMIQSVCGMIYPETRLMIWHKPKGSQYAGSSNSGLWYSYETILYCNRGYDKPKALVVGTMIRVAREGKQLSRGAVDMVIRGKKTGLCYRWEEAACLPTMEQAMSLCQLLGLSDDFMSTLDKARLSLQKAINTDVFSYRTVTNGNHPCAKPEGLIVELIGALTSEGDIILDPFTGGGTVPAVCKMLGRHYLAFEIDPETAELARQRVANTQPPLLIPQPQQAELVLDTG